MPSPRRRGSRKMTNLSIWLFWASDQAGGSTGGRRKRGCPEEARVAGGGAKSEEVPEEARAAKRTIAFPAQARIQIVPDFSIWVFWASDQAGGSTGGRRKRGEGKRTTAFPAQAGIQITPDFSIWVFWASDRAGGSVGGRRKREVREARRSRRRPRGETHHSPSPRRRGSR